MNSTRLDSSILPIYDIPSKIVNVWRQFLSSTSVKFISPLGTIYIEQCAVVSCYWFVHHYWLMHHYRQDVTDLSAAILWAWLNISAMSRFVLSHFWYQNDPMILNECCPNSTNQMFVKIEIPRPDTCRIKIQMRDSFLQYDRIIGM